MKSLDWAKTLDECRMSPLAREVLRDAAVVEASRELDRIVVRLRLRPDIAHANVYATRWLRAALEERFPDKEITAATLGVC